MGNVPVMGIDPDGNFAVLGSIVLGKIIGSALIGAGINAAAYTTSVAFSSGGFSNWSWGQFGNAVGMGAISGASIAAFGPLAGGALGRGITSSMNGGDFGKGAIVGAVGGYLSQFGGGSFANNVLWGAGTGAATGALGAALYDQDIGQGALVGAAFGGGLAAGFSTVESIKNAKDGYGFGTNDGRFNKMTREAVSGGTVNATKAQDALDFWVLRNGGPKLNYTSTGSPSTDIYGNIKISGQKFIDGVGHVRRSIAHEMGHYINNVNWDNGLVGGKVSNPKWVNLNRSVFRGDGTYGYHGAIKNAGRYHVGLGAISDGITAPLVAPAWQGFGWRKWWHLIPRRY